MRIQGNRLGDHAVRGQVEHVGAVHELRTRHGQGIEAVRTQVNGLSDHAVRGQVDHVDTVHEPPTRHGGQGMSKQCELRGHVEHVGAVHELRTRHGEGIEAVRSEGNIDLAITPFEDRLIN